MSCMLLRAYMPSSVSLTDDDLRVWQSNLRLGACHRNSAIMRGGGSCDSTDRGSIATPVNVSWSEVTRACVEHCLACARCNYVSMSAERGYCTWYTECKMTNLWRHGQHDAFTGHVPKQRHLWLAHSRTAKQSDDAPTRLQERLDLELRRRPLRGALPSDAGLHRSESCLRDGRWLLAIGTSVTRILFMRLVEEHIGMNAAEHSPCAPGWRYQRHGACDSLKRGAPCVIDVRSNSSSVGVGVSGGGGVRFTFVWAYGWAQHADVPAGVLATATSLRATAASNALRSEAVGARRLVGRFAVQTAEALTQLLLESPRAPDVLLSGPGAWNLATRPACASPPSVPSSTFWSGASRAPAVH